MKKKWHTKMRTLYFEVDFFLEMWDMESQWWCLGEIVGFSLLGISFFNYHIAEM